MSSYVDANYGFRRARYATPRMSRRELRRIKLMAVAGIVALLSILMIGAAYGGGRAGTEQVVVEPGQTLWSIAAQRYPEDDTRQRVTEIVQLNQLGTAPIYAGERIEVPAP